ncbi:hypothetical protein THAOC_07407, partial [Thalassiosira oceanica]
QAYTRSSALDEIATLLRDGMAKDKNGLRFSSDYHGSVSRRSSRTRDAQPIAGRSVTWDNKDNCFRQLPTTATSSTTRRPFRRNERRQRPSFFKGGTLNVKHQAPQFKRGDPPSLSKEGPCPSGLQGRGSGAGRAYEHRAAQQGQDTNSHLSEVGGLLTHSHHPIEDSAILTWLDSKPGGASAVWITRRTYLV